ncbi:hypothetical protein LEN_2978 [Lysobacter enzymogenes]|uniref:Uncharacterized protein n=1 Tax=Lysobacter enzymogenes TaxID=69 RepID=A0AAU9ATJ6_LYSEN|nr:hypothetical protein LEN_2978 [Lysobacter enzymogenes]
MADRGLGDVELVGRAGQAERARGGFESLERAEIDTGVGHRRSGKRRSPKTGARKIWGWPKKSSRRARRGGNAGIQSRAVRAVNVMRAFSGAFAALCTLASGLARWGMRLWMGAAIAVTEVWPTQRCCFG